MKYSNLTYFKPRKTNEAKITFFNNWHTPVVIITPEAYVKMIHYVDIANAEVGWMGTVEEMNGNYLISDVFLFEQEVSAAETTITEDGLAKFAEEMLAKEEGMEIMNKLKFWGHSHVTMGTGPSAQDDNQMDLFSDSGYKFFIRGIFNKLGDINFKIYNYEGNFAIEDVKWVLRYEENEELRDQIQAEFDEKVTERTYAVGVPLGAGRTRYNYGVHGGVSSSTGWVKKEPDTSKKGIKKFRDGLTWDPMTKLYYPALEDDDTGDGDVNSLMDDLYDSRLPDMSYEGCVSYRTDMVYDSRTDRYYPPLDDDDNEFNDVEDDTEVSIKD